MIFLISINKFLRKFYKYIFFDSDRERVAIAKEFLGFKIIGDFTHLEVLKKNLLWLEGSYPKKFKIIKNNMNHFILEDIPSNKQIISSVYFISSKYFQDIQYEIKPYLCAVLYSRALLVSKGACIITSNKEQKLLDKCIKCNYSQFKIKANEVS